MINNTSTYTDFQELSKLRHEARQESPEAIKKVAQQFEALFVQMMLKSMRDAMPEGGLFGSQQERMYQDMYDKQVSMNISSGQGIGLAAVIERQLSKQQPNQQLGLQIGQQADQLNNKTLEDYRQQSIAMMRAINPGSGQTMAIDHPYREQPMAEPVVAVWQKPEDFVNDLWPHAQQAAKQLGVTAEVLVAQSALETGWGKHIRPMENGQNSYSLFGIKANQHWQGKTVSVSTLEYRDGTMQPEQARFRAYDSIGEAFRDYVDFIESSPRYQQALERGYDPSAYAQGLQKAGYATDPDYARKIERIRNSDLLNASLSGLKNG